MWERGPPQTKKSPFFPKKKKNNTPIRGKEQGERNEVVGFFFLDFSPHTVIMFFAVFKKTHEKKMWLEIHLQIAPS